MVMKKGNNFHNVEDDWGDLSFRILWPAHGRHRDRGSELGRISKLKII